jgi:cell wall-associated NlpC family hydrolase
MASAPGQLAAILKGIGAPVTPTSLHEVQAWQQAEGGNASFNPFNTTQPAGGAGSYNSVGVRNYLNPQQGTQATIQTLQNGRYGSIINDLRSGAPGGRFAADVGASPWGTSGSLIARVLNTPMSSGGGSAAPTYGSNLPPGTIDPAVPNGHITFDAGPTNLGLAALTNFGNHEATMRGMPQQAPVATPHHPIEIPLYKVNAAVGADPQLSALPGHVAASAQKAVDLARAYMGTPYKWGGADPKTGFDCSGLLQYVYKQAGVNLPRTAAEQFNVGTPVDLQHLEPGDAVFFRDSSGIHHVGLSIGHGSFIEAPHTGDVVKVASLSDPYFARQFAGGRRYG